MAPSSKTPRAKTKKQVRDLMVEDVVRARQVSQELHDLQRQFDQLRSNGESRQLEALASAQARAQDIGYENLDQAFPEITEEEFAAAEARLATQNGNEPVESEAT